MAIGPTRLEFPLAGIDRNMAVQWQRPFTTWDARNARSIDAIARRNRGGSRPGIVKAFSQQVSGGSNEVNVLNLVLTTDPSGSATLTDALGADTNWDAASWAGGGIPTFTGGQAVAGSTGSTYGAVLKSGSVPSVQQSAGRTVSIYIDSSYRVGSTFYVYANMDNSSPADTDSVSVDLAHSTATGATTLTVRQDGTQISQVQDLGPTDGGWLSLMVEDGVLTGRFDGEQKTRVVNATATLTIAGDNAGFTMFGSSSAPRVDTFRYEYTSSAESPPALVVAAANGALWKEAPKGTLVAVSTNITLNNDPLMSCPRLNKLYIADWEEGGISSGTGGTMTSGVLDDSAISSWDALNIDTSGDVVEIISVGTDGSPSTSTGWYLVSSVHDTNGLTLTDLSGSASSADGSTGIEWRVVPGIKVFIPDDDAVYLFGGDASNSKLTAGNAPPYGCRFVCTYRDRLVFAGDEQNSGVFFMSRQGDPLDYDYSATDIQAAFAASTTSAGAGSTLGQIGSPITALIPAFEDYLLIGGKAELNVVRGDPIQGGTLDNISRTVGVIDWAAWAVTDDDQLFILSADGLYRTSKQRIASLAEPERLSHRRLPGELRDIDTSLTFVRMAYDPEFIGVWIWVTSLAVGASERWFYDLTNEAFWKDTAASDHDAFSATLGASPDRILFGCRDGYVRKFSEAATDDDGTGFTSYVDFGPILMGNAGEEGILDEVEVMLGEDSQDVDVGVRGGATADEAKDAAEFANQTMSAGHNYLFRPGMRNRYAFLRYQNDSDAHWAHEGSMANIKRAGPHRRA